MSTQLGVEGIGDSTAVVASPAVGATITWAKATYAFTAMATSHVVRVQGTASTGDATVLVDDVTVTQDAWLQTVPAGTAPQAAASDTVVRSQSGRILANTLTDGAAVELSTYSYDAAGRLVTAVIPRYTLTYGFTQASTCGVNTAAGRDGNRTTFADVRHRPDSGHADP